MSFDWTDLVGNIGVGIVIITYLGLQMERIDPKTLAYSVANIVGALCIMVSLWRNFNLSAFVIEVFWLAISIYGVWRVFVRSRKPVSGQ
ncbi:MAG: hypothetical protein AAF385_05545 [Pseudomonadota bacterium]